MRSRRWIWVLGSVLALLAAGGLFAVGRLSSDLLQTPAQQPTGAPNEQHSGDQAGYNDGYLDGLSAGQAQGRREGRALQEGAALPAGARQPVQDAFTAGYSAGANDVFGQYDGGWDLSTPYLVTIEQGSGPIAYRIATREALQPGVDYYLCPDGHHVCQQPRATG